MGLPISDWFTGGDDPMLPRTVVVNGNPPPPISGRCDPIVHEHRLSPEARLDWYRGQALAGLLSGGEWKWLGWQKDRDAEGLTFPEWIAIRATAIARAMVALEEKPR